MLVPYGSWVKVKIALRYATVLSAELADVLWQGSRGSEQTKLDMKASPPNRQDVCSALDVC